MNTYQTKSTKLLKPALIGSLYYLFYFLLAGSYFPFLNVYFAEIGLNGEQIGLLAIIQPVLTILFLTAISSLADRTHKRVRFAQIAMAGSAVFIFLLQFPASYAGIAALLFSFSVFSTPIMALADGLISRMAQRRGINYGNMRMWGSFMFGVASLLFGAIWQHFGYRPMFVITAVLYFPTILIINRVEEGPMIAVQKRQPIASLFRDPGVLMLLLSNVLAGISNSLFLIFGSVFARSLGAGSLLIGLMIAFGAIVEVPMMFLNVRISGKLGKVNTILLSYGLMAMAYIGYVLAPGPNILPVFTIFKGLGFGLWSITTIRLLVERTPDEWAATAQSLLTLCLFGISPLIAGPLGGWVHDAISPAAVFGLAVISLLLGAVVLVYASLRKQLS